MAIVDSQLQYNIFYSSYGTIYREVKENMKVSEPHDINNNATTYTAREAYKKVLPYGRATFVQDAVDERIVDNVWNKSYTYEGCTGSSQGIIDFQRGVGGWPELESSNPPIDTSKDRMPVNQKKRKRIQNLILTGRRRMAEILYSLIEF